MWGAKYLEDTSKQIGKNEADELAELQGVEAPENYTGSFKAIKGLSGGNATVSIQSKLLDLTKSLWAKSFLSDFILKTNDS
jgi:hypothetical protein